ncbi:MAG: T9SS type A sorting domain-containing protein [Owenweeksia sp.]
MRKLVLLTVMTLGLAFAAQAQYPFVSINQINQPKNLANCNDSSMVFGDTVKTVGVVVTDGGLSEVASGSVIGGLRPFLFLVDTANGGAPGPYKGLEMMAIYENAQGAFQANSLATQLFAGDIIEVTGYIGAFENSNQITTLDANSISIIGSANTPSSTVIPLSDLNDANRVNNIQDGQQWEGSFVELQNVTVTDVIPFGNGRISFNVADGSGNVINVSDRFLAQKTSSHQVVNPNSPAGSGGTGSFVTPVPGTFYNFIKGVVRHSANGCTGGGGRGFEINPFDDAHYDLGFAPPFISDVDRDPVVPNPNQDVDIIATITDLDGTVDSVSIGWSADTSVSPSAFPVFSMPLAIGSVDEYEFSIPKQAEGTIVRYYIYAEDNEGNGSYYPNKPFNQPEPNYEFYTVRTNGLTIADVQFSLTGNGNSPYIGRTVTVKGVVTASTKPYDLGYVYIQDTAQGGYTGISLLGNPNLANLFRNEWVEVSGDVQENFGFTQIAVSSLTRLNKYDVIQPTSIDPSDSAAYANGDWEKYESMLVKFENPAAGGKLYISNADAGFGDYTVATDPAFGMNKSARVLAGRQSSSAASSLWVQLVTDSAYETQDGAMFVGPVETSDTMTMDAVVGVLSYGFSNYRILPRANDDIIGLNVQLDTTNRSNPFSVEEIVSLTRVDVYPNPASEWFRIKSLGHTNMSAEIYDLNGRMIMAEESRNGEELEVNVSGLTNGIYLMRVQDKDGNVLSTQKVIVRK